MGEEPETETWYSGRYDITKYVEDTMMPWKYPFNFHMNTLSPDVGVKVAKLSKYHSIVINVYVLDSNLDINYNDAQLTVTVAGVELTENEEDEDDKSAFTNAIIRFFANAQEILDSIEDYFYNSNSGVKIKVGETSTWYAKTTNKYEVRLDTISNVVTENIDETFGTANWNVNFKAEKVTTVVNKLVDETPVVTRELNNAGINEMNNILFGQSDTNDIAQKISLEANTDAEILQKYELRPRYIIANAMISDAKNNLTKPKLLIETSIDQLLKSMYDMYSADKNQKNDGKSYDDATETILTNPTGTINSSQVKEIRDKMDKDGSRTYYDFSDAPLILRELIEYFDSVKLIDGTNYSIISSFQVYDNFARYRWPFSVSNPESVGIEENGDLQKLSLNVGETDRTVYAPLSGKITNIEEMKDNNGIVITGHYRICIEKTGYSSDSEAIDENSTYTIAKVIVDNVINIPNNIRVGADVISGVTKIGEVSSEVGKNYINFSCTDGTGTVEKEKIKNIVDEMLVLARLDIVFPVEGEIGPNQGQIRLTSWFGKRKPFTCDNGKTTGSFHNGIDICRAENVPVLAFAEGKVATVSNDPSNKYVTINHGRELIMEETYKNDEGYELYSWYYHLNSVTVSAGDHVEKGQQIGTLGRTGNVTGPHLHFQLNYKKDREPDIPFDPLSIYFTNIPSCCNECGKMLSLGCNCF